MRDLLLGVLAALLLTPTPVAAQRVDAPPDLQQEDADVATLPRRAITASAGVAATRLTLGDALTVSQVTVPVRVRVPIGQRFGVGLQTRYVTSGGETPSGDDLASLSGFGDAELSLSAEAPAGPAVVVASLVAAVPLGERGLASDAFATAALLSRDDLALDVPGLGGGARIGPALTVALPLGTDAAFGLGVSALVSSAYEPFADVATSYAPAPETALTGGYTQTSGGSTLAVDVTYVFYGDDTFGESVYSPGDKLAATILWQKGPGFAALRGRLLRDGARGDGAEVAPARPVQASIAGGVAVGPRDLQVGVALGARYYGSFDTAGEGVSATLDLLGKQQLIFEGGLTPRALVSPGVTVAGQLGYSLGLGEVVEIEEIPALSGVRFGLGVEVEL